MRSLPRRMSPERRRVLLWLGTLRSRQGDYRRAATLFKEGFAGLRWAPGGTTTRRLSHREFLFFLNERAILATFLGELDRAIELCDEGIEVAGDSRVHTVREATLNLLATRANVSVRRFEYDEAIERLRRSNEIADAIGSPANQGAVLNNLGVVYQNCDRYGEAIAAFEKAERICLSLDEGPSLVSIYGNMAILRAKRGEYLLAERALLESERLRPSVVGKQQELFDRHCRGLCALYRGQYQEAFRELTESGRIAIETGARLLGAFDTVYGAEALCLRGDLGRARACLEDSLGEPLDRRVGRMAIARLVFVEALDGRGDRARDRLAEYEAASSPPTAPFLDAWDDLFIAWALSLLLIQGDDRDLGVECARRLDRAEEFFARTDLPPPLEIIRFIRAERRFLDGDLDGALRILAATTRTDHVLARASFLFSKRGARSESRWGTVDATSDSSSEWLTFSRILGSSGWARISLPGRRSRNGCCRHCGGSPPLVVEPWRPCRGTSRSGIPRSRCPSGPVGSRESRERKLERRVETKTRRRHRRLRPSGLPSVLGSSAASGSSPDLRPCAKCSNGWTAWRRAISPCSFTERLGRARSSSRGAFTRRAPERRARSSCWTLAAFHRVSSRSNCSERALARSPTSRRIARASSRAEPGARCSSTRSRTCPSKCRRSCCVSFRRGAIGPSARRRSRRLTSGFFSRRGSTPTPCETAATVRADFLERARVLDLQAPPLRQRTEDLRDLIDAFLEADGFGSLAVSDAAVARLSAASWPGNVRELRNFVARLRVEHPEAITEELVDAALAGAQSRAQCRPPDLLGTSLPELRTELERDYVVFHLERLGGDTRALSELLGISRQQLYRRCRRLGVTLRARRTGRGSTS